MRSTVLIFLSALLFITTLSTTAADLVYRNPRVYNVDYSFELVPDPEKIDRAKDLKLWVPIPREWNSQKAVKIVSVNPTPHAEYEDPEYGNRMLFWDFGKEPEKPSYKVHIKFRLESYEVHAEVDPEHIEPHDKTSKEYALYTRSTHTISITPKIKELAQEAVGDEKNPYLQAERILKFVGKKMRYKIHRHARGVGTKCLLDFPVIDKKTGEEHYEGSCEQYSALFVALCRAAGIPARTVAGFIGWRPWTKEEDLKLRYGSLDLETSPDGLAAAQHYMALGLHTWAEFYVPNYGWIPADAQTGRSGHLSNTKLIISKARDVQIGPQSPEKQSEGYGSQWVLLNNGRADLLRTGVLNIAKIRTAKVKILHHEDPFPACGLNEYAEKFYPVAEAEERKLRILSWTNHVTRGRPEKNAALAKAYQDDPSARYSRDAFICHMLRDVVGGEAFFEIVKGYESLRINSGEPVSAIQFQKLVGNAYGEPLDWFFNQWVNSTELPRLKLGKVAVRKDKIGWQVHGRLLQSGDTIFRLPIELALDTKNGREKLKLWVDNEAVDFDLSAQNEPQKLTVDPDYEILKIQRMPPHLWWFWDVYPNLIVIYGTLAEAEANRTAVERFNDEYLGLGHEIIKADTDVTEEDLKAECVIFFGRPATSKIAQRFKDTFPIKFDEGKFTWQGTTYDQPTQGVAQIVENPLDPRNVIVLYAGLSGDAIQGFCDLYLYDADASYVIFDHDKQLVSGDWEVDSDLVWEFEADRE